MRKKKTTSQNKPEVAPNGGRQRVDAKEAHWTVATREAKPSRKPKGLRILQIEQNQPNQSERKIMMEFWPPKKKCFQEENLTGDGENF